MKRTTSLPKLLLLLGSLAACAKAKESESCLSLRDQARDAAAEGALERATSLLAQARKECTAKSEFDLRRIEKLVAEKAELARVARKREQEQKALAAKIPAKRFVSWVIKERAGAFQNLLDVQCAARGQADFGFCEARHPESPADMAVRYWDAQKSAFRFSFSTEAPLGCQDLGDHRPVRSWSRDQTTYELCDLTSHELRSLSALLVRSPLSTVLHVFSHAYVQRDKSFEQLVRGKI